MSNITKYRIFHSQEEDEDVRTARGTQDKVWHFYSFLFFEVTEVMIFYH